MIVLLSGGMDSSTLLAAAAEFHKVSQVRALGVLYGQRHSKELDSARAIAGYYKIPFEVVDLSGLRKLWQGSSQTSDDIAVPHGHYADESMRLTVVPNRNMTMMCVAAGYALSLGDEEPAIGIAAHAGDHAIYPDCRPEFIDAARAVLAISDYKPVRVWAPFLDMTKADIAKLGSNMGVPFDMTWSCYEGRELHCGKCGTCVERREAFVNANRPDPTVYED